MTPSDHRWSTRGTSKTFDVRLVSPPIVVGPGTFSFSFRHRYTFYSSGGLSRTDGGVIEISSDDGKTWEDVGTAAISVGYDQRLSIASGHALANRSAFTRNNVGFPGFRSVTVTPTSSLSGKTVRVRFRRGGFAVPGDNFWEIDDMSFSGIAEHALPFDRAGSRALPRPREPGRWRRGHDRRAEELTRLAPSGQSLAPDFLAALARGRFLGGAPELSRPASPGPRPHGIPVIQRASLSSVPAPLARRRRGEPADVVHAGLRSFLKDPHRVDLAVVAERVDGDVEDESERHGRPHVIDA